MDRSERRERDSRSCTEEAGEIDGKASQQVASPAALTVVIPTTGRSTFSTNNSVNLISDPENRPSPHAC